MGSAIGKKRKNSSERAEALRVLFDVLVAQLMKSQAFLREMANHVFRQFCSELDQGSLANIISIISTPTARNNEVLDSDDEDEDDDEESGEGENEYGAEVSEDSDLL